MKLFICWVSCLLTANYWATRHPFPLYWNTADHVKVLLRFSFEQEVLNLWMEINGQGIFFVYHVNNGSFCGFEAIERARSFWSLPGDQFTDPARIHNAPPPIFSLGIYFSSRFWYEIIHNMRNQKPNSWTYNFIEVSGHNLESSQTWGFCMDFLNQREEGIVYEQVFLLSPLQKL